MPGRSLFVRVSFLHMLATLYLSGYDRPPPKIMIVTTYASMHL